MTTHRNGRKSGTQNLAYCEVEAPSNDKHVYCIRSLLKAYISYFPSLTLDSSLWYSYAYNGTIDYSFSLSFGSITLFRGQKESRTSHCKLECCVIQQIALFGADLLEPYMLDDWYEAAELSNENRASVLRSFLLPQTSLPIAIDEHVTCVVDAIIRNLASLLDFYFEILDTEPVFCFAEPSSIKFLGREFSFF